MTAENILRVAFSIGRITSSDIKPLVWKSEDKHTLDISHLVNKEGVSDSAQFGVAMIEGVEKVRFIKST